jgi:hypothetical protein
MIRSGRIRRQFEADDVRLLQLQFGGVFTGDDALACFYVIGEAVQQRRLSRTRAPRNHDVATNSPDDLENFRACRRDGAEFRQLVESELVLLEFSNCQRRAVDRQRRRNHVDARTVQQSSVANRRGLVHPTSDLADDALANVHQLSPIAETNVRQLNPAADFDEAA